MDNSEYVIALLSHTVPGMSMMRQHSRPKRPTPESAHEPEFLSVEVLDHSRSVKEETQTIDYVQPTTQSGHPDRSLYSTSSAEEIIFISENNEFIGLHDNPVKRDDDNSGYIDSAQQSNEIEIIVEQESGDDFHLTDDMHDENWQFLNAKTE